MGCSYFENDSLNRLNEKDRSLHIKECPLCAERESIESQIEIDANLLPAFKPDASLWAKIENEIKANEKSKRKNTILKRVSKQKIWLRAAAILFVTFSITALYFASSSGSENILSSISLLKVELTERSYLSAIEDLEMQADSKMAEMDFELSFLYRDKLETINVQIAQCEEAINKNPGNAHIRRYMLAALQDKKETLNEIIMLQPNTNILVEG